MRKTSYPASGPLWIQGYELIPRWIDIPYTLPKSVDRTAWAHLDETPGGEQLFQFLPRLHFIVQNGRTLGMHRTIPLAVSHS